MVVMALPAEPEVVGFDVEWLLALASQHADYSANLQCEVDDLRQLVRLAWGSLSGDQRGRVIASAEVAEAVEAEYMPTKPVADAGGADWLVGAAREHGEADDPDHEAGDLQGFVRAMWREMSTGQHRNILVRDEFAEIAELGGCAREMAKPGDEVDSEDWAAAVDHFGLDESFQYGAQQVADYMNAFTLQGAIANEDAHTKHPMKASSH